MKNNRGVSNLIIAILLVLVTLSAVALLWSFVSFALRDRAEIAEAKSRLFSERIDIKHIDGNFTEGSNLTLFIERESQEFVLVNLSVVEKPISVDIISAIDTSWSGFSNFSCRGSNGELREMCVLILARNLCRNASDYDRCFYFNLNEATCRVICGGSSWSPPIFERTKSTNEDFFRSVLSAAGARSAQKRISLLVFAGGNLSGQTQANSSKHLASTGFTNNLSYLHEFSRGLYARQNNTPGCLCCGINEAKKVFEDTQTNSTQKVIVLLSTGSSDYSCLMNGTKNDPSEDAILVAEKARSAGITVHTIGLLEDPLKKTFLERIAVAGGGRYYQANLSDLVETYTQVLKEVQKVYVLEETAYMLVWLSNGTDSREITISGSELPRRPGERVQVVVKIEPPLPNLKQVKVYPMIKTPSGKIVRADSETDSWKVEAR